METDVHLQSYLPQFFLQKKYFQAKFVEKIKKNRLISIICFRKSCNLRDNVEKYCRSGQATIIQHGACALHAGQLRLQTHIQNL